MDIGEILMTRTNASNRRALRASTALCALLLLEAGFVATPAMAQDATTDPAVQTPSGAVEGQPTPVASAQGEPVERPQDIVVTGSRIPQPNLTSASPVTVVSDQDIKLSGSSRIEDVLNQLPSVGAAQAAGQSNGATGTAEVDLRYLGPKRTLALVNGRRMTPGDPNENNQSADLNLLPSSLIKRVEVLTGGASSVYGADAVAGVVNFIIDTEFEGIRFDGQISTYQHKNDNPSVGGGQNVRDILNAKGFGFPTGSDTDGRAFDGTMTIGAGFDDGRGHAVAYFGYRKVKPVLAANRDFSSCVIQNTRAGAPTCGGSATAAPGTGVVFATTTDGGITSTVAALGPGTITPFASNTFNFAPLNYFQRPDERYTAGAFANYEINDAIKPYLEFMFMDDRTLAQIAPSGDFGNTQTINCNNPFLSAQQLGVICGNPNNLINGFLGNFPLAVGAGFNPNPDAPPIDFIDPTTGETFNRAFFQLLRRNVEGGPRVADLRHTSFRGVVGTRGDLSNVWSYDAYYQYGRTNYTQVYKNEFSVSRLSRALDAIDDPRTPGVVDPICRSVLDGTDPNCVPYNAFGTAPSAASINYLNVFGVIQGTTTEKVLNANVTGSLGEMGLRMPWAEDGIGVNFGVEHRNEALELNPDQSFQTNDLAGQGGATLPVSGSFRVNEFFAEAQVPIIQKGFVEELTLGGGYRKSYYKTSAGRKYDTDTYKLSAEFAPIRDIRFRAAYNRAVRAPNIQELFGPQSVALDGTRDPCAGHVITPTEFGCIAQGLAVGRRTPSNPAGQYNGLLGGNPDLNPEKATTKTIGVVFQPSFVPRLAVTVDYFDINLKDAIQGLGADAILAACNSQTTATTVSPACALINRDASGSIWLTNDGFVSDLPLNTSEIDTSGIDVNVSYSHRLGGLGNLSGSFIGTWMREYRNDNGLSEPYDCAGFYGPVCSGGTVAASAPIPKWRHKARLSLQTPFGLGLSLQSRFVGKVRAETLQDNDTVGGDFNFNPGLKIKSQTYFDLAATYAFRDRINLRAGVNNILDNDPPLVTSGSSSRDGSNLCPTGPCNNNTYPGTWDALGRFFYLAATIDFKPRRSAPIPAALPVAPAPAPAPVATQTCADGSVILATDACPAAPVDVPPPAPAPERG
jgi:outer membrane receptor protein involved in Fe transport